MQVIKRNGKIEEVKLQKITRRVEKLSYGLKVEPLKVAQKVIAGIYDKITSKQIDELLSETASLLGDMHPHYLKLAARIAVSSLHKETTTFFQTMKNLYKSGALSKDFIELVIKHGKALDKLIDEDRDYEFSYMGYKTLEKSYLLRIDGSIVERPQYMYMRVALFIAGDDIGEVKELYDLLSQGYYTHATPTLFNAGTTKPQLSSCFVVAMKEDSIEGIADTQKECMLISKNAGGIGLHLSNIRAKGTPIKGTNGTSNGIVPMLQVFNSLARYVDQGGGKRKGSIAAYLEPWHADVLDFLDLKLPTGKDEIRARDLFYAMWIPDLFMERVEKDEDWTLMCPNECTGLTDVYGNDFKNLYEKYEREGKGKKVIKARDVMVRIIESQTQTGNPYMLYKDSINRKSNQKNIGIIKSSNLCTEITEVSTPEETSVCNLASIALPKFVVEGEFSHEKLHEISKIVTKNLNKVIDKNYYPTDASQNSNLRHRPIGIGVQGLANVFFKLGIAYDSEEARILNKDIFETIYHGALEASCEEAYKYGVSLKDKSELGAEGAYSTFVGSPASKGILQYDMWGVEPSDRWDWVTLKNNIKKYGLRNSLLLAPMPTASTASILGNIEAFEAQTSNIYKRQVLSGEFIQINENLVEDLEKLGLWSKELSDKLKVENGSVQNIPEIPNHLKEIYKTVWEISQKVIIDMAADRGAFIDQSQSLNLWLADPNFGSINSMHFYAWKKGLKTGMYYLRSKASGNAVKVTVDDSRVTKEYTKEEAIACSLDNPEACEACGS